MADTLLLIDDDPDVLRGIGDYFERLGYEVAREATGEAGAETYERLRPAVVILDLHLPDAGGLDILERLRPRRASPRRSASRARTRCCAAGVTWPTGSSRSASRP